MNAEIELPYDHWVLDRLKPVETLPLELLETQPTLPEDLDLMAHKLDLADAVRLSQGLVRAYKVKPLRLLASMLLETIQVRPIGFYVHLLALLCGVHKVPSPLVSMELEQALAEENEAYRLGAWISLDDPVRAIRQIPLNLLYQTLGERLGFETELGPLFAFHLLAGLLAAEGNWNSLQQRCRCTPLFHVLIRELYRQMPLVQLVLPQWLRFLDQLKAHDTDALKRRYLPLEPLCCELAALPNLDARVRKQWEKKDRASDRLHNSIDTYLKKNQDGLPLRLGSLNGFIRQFSQQPREEGSFGPILTEQRDSKIGCGYYFAAGQGNWTRDQRRQKSGTKPLRQDVYQAWLAQSYQHFRSQYWLQRREYSTLWIEEGEISFLYLIWALWRMDEAPGEYMTPVSVTQDDLGHSLDPEQLADGQLGFGTFEQLLDQQLGLFSGPDKLPSARFWALYDFILREQYFQDKLNTLLVARLSRLARGNTALLEGSANARERMLAWCKQLYQRLHEPSLSQYMSELSAKGYFSLVFTEMVLRRGDSFPRILFLHPLISEKWHAGDQERYQPYVLISGHLLASPDTVHLPFSARRCSALLWPAINWLSFALTDSLVMEQVRNQQERMVQLERDRREKENFERVAGKLDHIFGLERQLNTLLENVRQSITPPSMSAFGIGNWRQFSQIFQDHSELMLKDGRILYGNHSSRSVTVLDLDDYLRYVQEQIDPPPGSFIPLFEAAWQRSDRSAQTARKCFGLLKLICYDSNDRQKELYWCQVLVALRALGQDQRIPLMVQASRQTRQDERDLSAQFSQSDDAVFLLGLLDEIDAELTRFRYATDARWRVPHSFALAPVELLQSIAWLTHHELQPDRDSIREKVRLEQIQARFSEPEPGCFSLSLIWSCQGRFGDLDKLLSFESGLYHSTRYHLGMLARAVGQAWQPILVQTLEQAQVMLQTPSSPLTLLSCIDADRTWLSLQLGHKSSVPAIPLRQARQFEDLEA